MQFQAISEVPFSPGKRTLNEAKLYLFWFSFTLGNLLLPMIVHAIPNGGMIFLPLFFFTLVAAYSEGLLVGTLVAISSPLINYFLTGMPMLTILPIVLFKSLLIAISASIVANTLKKINLVAITLIVVAMQVMGSLFEYVISGNIERALYSFKLGIPGMIIVAFAGYALLRIIAKVRD